MKGIKRIQYRQLLVLVISWQVAAVLVALYDHFMIHTVFVEINTELYSFPLYLLFNMTAALLGALTAGPRHWRKELEKEWIGKRKTSLFQNLATHENKL